ncbi:Cysteine proteinase [Diplonema papillatum]|nr:Cysteine proteinase [Diplonema papillatum]
MSLSEQVFVSCDMVAGGCNGGSMIDAWAWRRRSMTGRWSPRRRTRTRAARGSAGSASGTPACPWARPSRAARTSPAPSGGWRLGSPATGPLSIAVDASQGWQTYTGGIVSDCTGHQLDHGVLIVGWTPDYWIVKNSWGPTWGGSGRIRLQFGTDQCGLIQQPCSASLV